MGGMGGKGSAGGTFLILGDSRGPFAYHAFMTDVIKVYYLVFGVLTLIGGIIGFVKANSLPSLIAGTVCGLILLAAGIVIFFGHLDLGLILGILVSVALAGQFVPKVMLNRPPIHSALMALLSVTGVVLTLIAFAKR